MRNKAKFSRPACVAGAAILLLGTAAMAEDDPQHDYRGYDVTPTWLRPVFPSGLSCPPITSLYGSFIDVDGSRRTEAHTGIDAGRLGDEVLAPGPGTIGAVWETDFGWGREGSLLLIHERDDLNLVDGPRYYYSEFDHLSYDEIKHVTTGAKILRGQVLAHVSRPGGNKLYLPEVHWEVYEVDNLDSIKWHHKASGSRYFTNENSALIDPLYMLSLEKGISRGGAVQIVPYESELEYTGFTYILRCRPAAGQ